MELKLKNKKGVFPNMILAKTRNTEGQLVLGMYCYVKHYNIDGYSLVRSRRIIRDNFLENWLKTEEEVLEFHVKVCNTLSKQPLIKSDVGFFTSSEVKELLDNRVPFKGEL